MTSASLSSPQVNRKLMLVFLVFAVAWASNSAAGPYREGQPIEIVGTVTDADGLPVPDVSVVLKARRNSFSFKKMGQSTRDTQRVMVTTDPRGEFKLTWRWYDYYNRFELQVGLPVIDGGEEKFRVFEKRDLRKIIQLGTPVVANMVITDTSQLETLKDFMSTVDSDDKQTVYEEMGRPGRVQNIEYPTYSETTWWYFTRGRAYRFRSGNLDQVVHFEPIEPIEQDG